MGPRRLHSPPVFGSHLSIAGSLVNALIEAERLKMDTVQIFTKNQQQWKVKPLDPGVVRDWRTEVDRLGWHGRTVAHASYLINLASPDDTLWERSIGLMRDEIERCEALGIPFLVHHPGAYTTSSREEGLARIAAAYRRVFADTRGARVVSCIENTVGGGSILGRDFGELALLRDMIVDATGATERLGVCFDTCHAHAGGYDLSTARSAESALRLFDETVGLTWIRVLHVNDSKVPAGSRRDRHEHIGKGTIGIAGFRAVVNFRGMADKPKILETPKGTTAAGMAHDTLNLRRLRSLLGRSPRARTSAPDTGG